MVLALPHAEANQERSNDADMDCVGFIKKHGEAMGAIVRNEGHSGGYACHWQRAGTGGGS